MDGSLMTTEDYTKAVRKMQQGEKLQIANFGLDN